MWALEGLKRLIEHNYTFTETENTARELEKYKRNNSSVLLFIDDCCLVKEDAKSLKEDVYSRYKDYCSDSGLMPQSKQKFNAEIANNFASIQDGRDKLAGNRHVWKGLALIDR